MTTGHRYQWEQMLDRAAYSFLDRYYPEDSPDDPEPFDKAVEELVVHLDAKLWDEWPGIRDEMQPPAAGQAQVPPERVQEVKAAAREQIEAARGGS